MVAKRGVQGWGWKRWSEPGYVSREEPNRNADQLEVQFERKNGVKYEPQFFATRMEFHQLGDGKLWEAGLWERSSSTVFMVSVRCCAGSWVLRSGVKWKLMAGERMSWGEGCMPKKRGSQLLPVGMEAPWGQTVSFQSDSYLGLYNKIH